VTHDRATPNNGGSPAPQLKALSSSYYGLLGVHPTASVQEIRRAYRDLSKLYHPDTTDLAADVATRKFQELNDAYATLSSPERRLAYDQKIGYSRIPVVQSLPNLHPSTNRQRSPVSSSAYLDPTDRPLSPGEVFAVFILGLTFVGCLVLAIAIGLSRGDQLLQPLPIQAEIPVPVVSPSAIAQPAQPLPPVEKPLPSPTSSPVVLSSDNRAIGKMVESDSNPEPSEPSLHSPQTSVQQPQSPVVPAPTRVQTVPMQNQPATSAPVPGDTAPAPKSGESLLPAGSSPVFVPPAPSESSS